MHDYIDNRSARFCTVQGLLKVCTAEGEEIYFQSAGPEDRDGWAHAIGAVIRSLSSATQVTTCVVVRSAMVVNLIHKECWTPLRAAQHSMVCMYSWVYLSPENSS